MSRRTDYDPDSEQPGPKYFPGSERFRIGQLYEFYIMSSRTDYDPDSEQPGPKYFPGSERFRIMSIMNTTLILSSPDPNIFPGQSGSESANYMSFT